jgi:hypothetical protein
VGGTGCRLLLRLRQLSDPSPIWEEGSSKKEMAFLKSEIELTSVSMVGWRVKKPLLASTTITVVVCRYRQAMQKPITFSLFYQQRQH